MAGAFQQSAFQFTGFQMDDDGGARPTGGRESGIEWWGRAWSMRDPPKVVVERQPGGTVLVTLLRPMEDARIKRNRAIAALLLAAA